MRLSCGDNGSRLRAQDCPAAKLPVSNPPLVMASVEHTVAVGDGVLDAVGVAGIVAVRVRVGVLDAVGVAGIVGVEVAQEPPTDRRTSSMNQPT